MAQKQPIVIPADISGDTRFALEQRTAGVNVRGRICTACGQGVQLRN